MASTRAAYDSRFAVVKDDIPREGKLNELTAEPSSQVGCRWPGGRPSIDQARLCNQPEQNGTLREKSSALLANYRNALTVKGEHPTNFVQPQVLFASRTSDDNALHGLRKVHTSAYRRWVPTTSFVFRGFAKSLVSDRHITTAADIPTSQIKT